MGKKYTVVRCIREDEMVFKKTWISKKIPDSTDISFDFQVREAQSLSVRGPAILVNVDGSSAHQVGSQKRIFLLFPTLLIETIIASGNSTPLQYLSDGTQ